MYAQIKFFRGDWGFTFVPVKAVDVHCTVQVFLNQLMMSPPFEFDRQQVTSSSSSFAFIEMERSVMLLLSLLSLSLFALFYGQLELSVLVREAAKSFFNGPATKRGRGGG